MSTQPPPVEHVHPVELDLLPRWHPATLAGAAWAVLACRSARRGYEDTTEVPTLPPRAGWLPAGAKHGVLAVLARRRERCLVRATVLQAWEAAHGRARDMVIGVTAPSRGFRAHAWLDGDPPCCSAEFVELTRRRTGQ